MSNIVTFAGANLPTVQSLSTALRKMEATSGPSGVVILKMDKHWSLGVWCRPDRGGRWQSVGRQSFLLRPRLYRVG
jgi:hypothetical protein